MDRLLEISPTDKDGQLKDADEVFLEAYNRVSSNGGTNGSFRKTAARLPTSTNRWNNRETPPSWYAVQLINKYDQAWLEWEPETIWITVEKDFRTPISELTKNKIGAVKTILLTDSFWREWHVLEKITQAFNGHIPELHMMEVPSVGELAWAIAEANYVQPGNEFSEETIQYIRGLCTSEGYVLYPEQLKFAQARPLGTLAQDVEGAWEMIRNLKKVDIIENALGVNLVRLQAVQKHVEEWKDER